MVRRKIGSTRKKPKGRAKGTMLGPPITPEMWNLLQRKMENEHYKWSERLEGTTTGKISMKGAREKETARKMAAYYEKSLAAIPQLKGGRRMAVYRGRQVSDDFIRRLEREAREVQKGIPSEKEFMETVNRLRALESEQMALGRRRHNLTFEEAQRFNALTGEIEAYRKRVGEGEEPVPEGKKAGRKQGGDGAPPRQIRGFLVSALEPYTWQVYNGIMRGESIREISNRLGIPDAMGYAVADLVTERNPEEAVYMGRAIKERAAGEQKKVQKKKTHSVKERRSPPKPLDLRTKQRLLALHHAAAELARTDKGFRAGGRTRKRDYALLSKKAGMNVKDTGILWGDLITISARARREGISVEEYVRGIPDLQKK